MIIVCLGDSLTSGFPGYSPGINGISDGYGNPQSQYEYWLKKFCLEYLEKDLGSLEDSIIENLQFINKGIPGELTQNLLNRIHHDVINRKPKPHYSIILGGSNDLGWGIPSKTILNNIQQLHKISREHNIISIGGTIPPIRGELTHSNYKEKKGMINQNLKTHFNAQKIPFADLFSGMSNEKGNLRKEYAYPDGLHFTVEGYKKMGKLLFQEVVKNILKMEFF
ncbi:MAG: hypothetical protein BAJALOKI1v1_1080008 [Promethearchaeota archaeon]|nr:MAG: hypothetical protein BAJALOKI1v1_1080008 [Candidatus Lokiarchaeota archaeon]